MNDFSRWMVLGVVGLVSLGGCATNSSYSFRTLESKTALARAQATVKQHAGGVATADTETGLVTSKWQSYTDLEDNRYFYRVRAQITPTDKKHDTAKVTLGLDVHVCDSNRALSDMKEQCVATKQLPSGLQEKFERFKVVGRKEIMRTNLSASVK